MASFFFFFLALDAFQLGTTVIGSIRGVEHIIRARRCLLLWLAAPVKRPQAANFSGDSLMKFDSDNDLGGGGGGGGEEVSRGVDVRKVKLIVFLEAHSWNARLFLCLFQPLPHCSL